ncbi:MAG TPA: DUF1203 domain-containing protein [Gammaproteobacteria bacterium]|nr:DUF1203 domain-containing protein [Gammaproteobacteria bacterium]
MGIRITGLPAAQFSHLFTLSDTELTRRSAMRVIADRDRSLPCRVSLTDARAGDEVILVNYEHLPVATPYRSRYAIFVREGEDRYDSTEEVPDQLLRRTLSLRAFSDRHLLAGCAVVEGKDLQTSAGSVLENPRVSYLHVHFAAAGCYAARVDRA